MGNESHRWQRGVAGRPLPLGWRQSHNYAGVGGPRFARHDAALNGGGSAGSDQLCVATYNVELVKRPDAVLALLERDQHLGGADILALQEADEEIVDRAARLLGAHYVYYPSMLHPLTGRNFGPAILSRWPIVDDGKVPLPGRGWTRGSRRIAVRATVSVRGLRIRVYSVHLSTMWEMLPRGQDAQAQAVADDAATSPDPVLIAGDLNRMGAGRVFARAGYHWLTRGVGRTHHVWSFDHVFLRGLEPRSVRSASVGEALATSDHRAVWTALEFASD
jgi:endonuclease/exonuclease/phosphatase family metal-dependent hydrolase